MEMIDFPKMMEIYPKMVANELVSVQPLCPNSKYNLGDIITKDSLEYIVVGKISGMMSFLRSQFIKSNGDKITTPDSTNQVKNLKLEISNKTGISADEIYLDDTDSLNNILYVNISYKEKIDNWLMLEKLSE